MHDSQIISLFVKFKESQFIYVYLKCYSELNARIGSMPFMTKYPGVLYLAVILIGVNIDTGSHGRCIYMSAFSYKTEFLWYVIIKLHQITS